MARAAFFFGVASSLAWAMGCSVSDEGLTFVPDDQVKTGAGGASAGAGGTSGTGGSAGNATGGTSGGGTGGTGGTTGGSGGAGGNPLEPLCQACLGDKCPAELGACVGDADCLKCIVNPGPACASKPNAQALRTCGCANCDKQCAALDKCGAGGTGGTGGSAGKGGGGTAGTGGAGAGGTAGTGGAGAGGTAGAGGSAGGGGAPVFSSCEQCIVSVCQKEVIACNQDAACSPCINGGGGPECQQNANLKAAQQCACTSECGELCGCATAFCGDGKISGKEDCDGADLGGKTCSTALGDPTALGSLSCSSSCHYDFSNCTAGTAFCGDKKVNQATEACDPPDLKTQTCATVTGNANATGTLGCNYKCGFDTSKCEIPGVCGDGVINAGEKCDGTKLNGATCSSVLGGGATGTLKCSSNCQYDTSKCSTGVMCGNGSIDFGEQCDGNNLAGFDCKKLLGSPLAVGSLTCNSNCTFNGAGCSIPQAVCNNGLKEAGEQCDKSDFGGADCKSATGDPTSIGTLQCTGGCTYDLSQCMKGTVYCGDGARNQANEQCDGGDLGGASCKDILNNPAAQGQLLCTTNCTFNTSQCSVPTGVCGDATLNQPTESCELTTTGGTLLPPGVTCQSLRNSKQAQGGLTCNPQTCSILDANCQAPNAACGNGILDPGEECEPNQIPTNCQVWLNDPSALVDATSQPQCVNCKIDASTCKTPCGGPCDLNQCDGVSVCDPASGKCTAGGPAPGLDDGNPCTFDYCDPMSGRVRHVQRADCCPHSVCKQGQTLNAVGCAVTPSMDQCLSQISFKDPYCYNNGWDGACQAHFQSQAGQPQFCDLMQTYSCQCAHPLCTEGAPMTPDCDPCVEAICQQDPHCCGQVWDAACVQKVQSICHIPPSGCN